MSIPRFHAAAYVTLHYMPSRAPWLRLIEFHQAYVRSLIRFVRMCPRTDRAAFDAFVAAEQTTLVDVYRRCHPRA